METGRELFNKFLNDEPLPRPVFVPMIRGLLSRVENMPMEQLMNDPALWANALVKTYKLFRFDGVVVGLDFTLMAEACGCGISWEKDRPVASLPQNGLLNKPEETGRMKLALETATRVFEVSRKEQACIAALTGPLTLADMLFGRKEGADHLGEIKQLMVQVTEAFCKTRPDVLIFTEGRSLGSAEINLSHKKIYNTLKNITDYYDVKAGLYVQKYDPARPDRFKGLKMDLYVLGPAADGSMPDVSRVWDLGEGALGVGLGLPLDDLSTARRFIKEGRELYETTGGRGIFFTSLGPVTRDVDVEMLHQLVQEFFHDNASEQGDM
ncbi:MAG: uroporphyrinogen decarboxylase family protein [Pseudomonadota bacterium]